MKNLFHIMSAVILTTLFSATLQAQVTVTAHATAEVVEAASLAANTSNNISVDSKSDASSIRLGEMTIKSGGSASCEIIVKSTSLQNASGSSFMLETTASQNSANSVSPNQNNRVINLSGNTNIPNGQSGSFQGSYTVVLAYN